MIKSQTDQVSAATGREDGQFDARLSVREPGAEEETLMLARRVTGAVVSSPEGEREFELSECPWRT